MHCLINYTSNPFPGLDNSPFRLRCILLFRRVQVPPERTHERHEPRHRPNPGAPDEAPQVPQTLLRTHQAHSDLRPLLLRRCERRPQEVQEDGREELRVPLKRD